jgi:hypothetical protein
MVSVIFSFATGEENESLDQRKAELRGNREPGILDWLLPVCPSSLESSMFARSAVFASKSVDHLQLTNRSGPVRSRCPSRSP